MTIPSDFAADLIRNQSNLPTDIMAQLILFYQKSIQVPEDDFVIDSFIYSPLIDLHDTSIEITGPTLEETDFNNHIGSIAYRKIIPETVHSDPLVYNLHDISGLTFNQPDTGFGTRFCGGVVGDDIGHIDIDDHSILNSTDTLTLHVWIYTTAASDQEIYISKSPGYILHRNANSIICDYEYNTVERSLSFSLPSDGWHHVVITIQSGNQNMYVDNVLVDSNTFTGAMTSNTNKLFIMAGQTGSAPLDSDGSMAWVSISHMFADAAWVNDAFNGILDYSNHEELVCFPFMQNVKPQGLMTSGLFVSGT